MSRPSKSDLPTIYCDMDQVLCNFLNGADKAVGGLFIHAQKDTRWEKIGATKDFWANLEWMPGQKSYGNLYKDMMHTFYQRILVMMVIQNNKMKWLAKIRVLNEVVYI